MSLRESDANRDDTCGEAVMAAFQAIGDHCGNGEVPVQIGDEMVVMAPKDAVERIEQQDGDEMSDQEILDELDENSWLSSWADSLCGAAGHEERTENHQQCRITFAREALR